jgi:hypothetical protein
MYNIIEKKIIFTIDNEYLFWALTSKKEFFYFLIS